jgi:hypothetical protein
MKIKDLPQSQRQNLKHLFKDIKTSINVSRSDIEFSSFKGDLKDAFQDGTLTRGEFRGIQREVKSIIREADISQEDAQTLLTDLQKIAVEAGLKRPNTIPQEQKKNVEKLISDVKNSIDGPPDEELVDDLKTTLTDALDDRALTEEELVAIAEDVIAIVDSLGITPEEARTIFYDVQDIANTSQLPRTNDDITGTDGDDILWGGLGNDTLSGAGAEGGVGEVDWLTGGGGKDRFALGNTQQVFYDDGASLTAGWSDFAAILDFNKYHDVIQLHGTMDAYQLAALPEELGISGTGIYQTENSNIPELIGVVVGVTLTDMSSGFAFL